MVFTGSHVLKVQNILCHMTEYTTVQQNICLTQCRPTLDYVGLHGVRQMNSVFFFDVIKAMRRQHHTRIFFDVK